MTTELDNSWSLGSSIEAYGQVGYGIKVFVKGFDSLNPNVVGNICSNSIESCLKELRVERVKTSAKYQQQREENIKILLSLFPEQNKIWYELTDNPYWYDEWKIVYPALIVTTTIGHFQVHHRKRVIEIDWTRTKCGATGVHLFDDDVTKSREYEKERFVHAWTVEKAKEYIQTIFNTVEE